MGSAVQKWSWFADAQESRLQATKRSEMCSAVIKVPRLGDTKESCLRLWNIHIRVVLPQYMVDLPVLRNRVFWFRNVQIWVVLSWKVVVLLIFTNYVFKLQNVLIWTVSKCKGVYLMIVRNGIFGSRNVQIIAFPTCKRVKLLILTLKYMQCCPARGWFADAQETRFQATKGSEMCSAVIKGPRFGDTQK